MTVKEALTILEVAATATPEEIQRAYRGLARVWHPDRFPNDPELQRKAQGKLKQINAAYETLKSAAFATSQASTPPPTPKPQPAPPSAPKPEPAQSQAPYPRSNKTTRSTKFDRSWKLEAWIFTGLFLFCGSAFIFFKAIEQQQRAPKPNPRDNSQTVPVFNDINQQQQSPRMKPTEPLKTADRILISPANEYTSPSSGMKFALIPTGEFKMGSPPDETKQFVHEDEWPQHSVRITKPFYMGVYEVTQGEFQKVLDRNTSSFQPSSRSFGKSVSGMNTDRFPVEGVTWFDAVEFCNKLSEADGQAAYYRLIGIERAYDQSIKKANVTVGGGNGYRLPTEAEWEYACRANERVYQAAEMALAI